MPVKQSRVACASPIRRSTCCPSKGRCRIEPGVYLFKNVVLVHGAFADGSGWEAVANILKDGGYKVSVVQHPETSYAEDQKYTRAAIDAMDGLVVLVGHSYGGSVITEAGNHPKVRALVYICRHCAR
jgi:pimeloyl-ACP methyl ester carboxylesterase